jgi:hypothetical protein
MQGSMSGSQPGSHMALAQYNHPHLSQVLPQGLGLLKGTPLAHNCKITLLKSLTSTLYMQIKITSSLVCELPGNIIWNV